LPRDGKSAPSSPPGESEGNAAPAHLARGVRLRCHSRLAVPAPSSFGGQRGSSGALKLNCDMTNGWDVSPALLKWWA
jgi:hypothetical protein